MNSTPLVGNPTAKQVRVFLVDDQPTVLRGLRTLLRLEPDMVVCGEAGDLVTAEQGITATNPDVAVVDLALGQDDGVDLIRKLGQLHPAVKVLVFSMHGQSWHVQRALEAGALGYVTKQEGTEKLVTAIRQLMQGMPYPG